MNIYEILNTLISYMADPDFNSTLENLAKKMNMPEKQVLAYIESLQNDKITKDLITKKKDNSYHFNSAPLKNVTDKNSIYHKRYISPTAKLFPLSRPEYKVFKVSDPFSYKRTNFEKDHKLTKNNGLFMIKTTLVPDISYDSDTINTIEKSIEQGATLSVTDKNNKKFRFTPHFIKRDINTRQLYAIQIYDDGYITAIRLDEIKEIKIHKKDVTGIKAVIAPKLKKRIESIWSFEYEELEKIINNKPCHVKLMVFDETGNIIEKMKRDILERRNAKFTGPFESDIKSISSQNYYYYEDDILGMDSFKHWVMKFGRSIIVLEPKTLGYDIYNEIVSSLK